MNSNKILIAAFLSLSFAIGPSGAAAAEEGWVIPRGQEDLIRAMLAVDPEQSGGWWLRGAQVPRKHIVATYIHLGSTVPDESWTQEDLDRHDRLGLRLVHRSAAPWGAPSTTDFALVPNEGESFGDLPDALVQALLESVRTHEHLFSWTKLSVPEPPVATSSDREPGFQPGPWLRPAMIVTVCLGLVAAANWFRSRRRRGSD